MYEQRVHDGSRCDIFAYNGNTAQKGAQHFTYDYRNQLISVASPTITINYKYDPFGRRVEKTIGGSTTKYFYDYNQVIEERNALNQVLKQYIYGNGIDEIIRVDKYESGNLTPYYYHTNTIGSVTAITDRSGQLVERISYDTFGMPTITDSSGEVISTSTIGNEYLFQGRRYDRAANLYYYRARYYDPIMGRFLQTDPMGYTDSMNLYQGFNMNPLNYFDPFGEEYFVFNQDRTRVTVYENRSIFLLSQLLGGRMGIPNFQPIVRNVLLNQVPQEFRAIINRLARMSNVQQKRVELLDREGGTNGGYNATAHAFNSYGDGEIEYDTFDARTIASAGNPRILNGDYVGTYTLHHGEYRAIRINQEIGGILSGRIPLVNDNPNYPFQLDISSNFSLSGRIPVNQDEFYSTTINIHRSGLYDITGFTSTGSPISLGCILIRRSQWAEFDRLINIQINERVNINLNTEENMRVRR